MLLKAGGLARLFFTVAAIERGPVLLLLDASRASDCENTKHYPYSKSAYLHGALLCIPFPVVTVAGVKSLSYSSKKLTCGASADIVEALRKISYFVYSKNQTARKYLI